VVSTVKFPGEHYALNDPKKQRFSHEYLGFSKMDIPKMSIFTFSNYFWLKIRIFKIKQGLTILINFFETPKYGTSFSIPFSIPFLPFENRGQ
jgi:hypothetical protein